ncbi:hypothetical protein JCM17960_05490 [Magnetospira thiophila]
MTNIRFFHALALASVVTLTGLSTGAMAAPESAPPPSESVGEYIDDVVVSNKVRGAIVADKDLSIFKIDVKTYKGIVQLSGFVDTAEVRDHAAAVAATVDGVDQVRNDLVVK